MFFLSYVVYLQLVQVCKVPKDNFYAIFHAWKAIFHQ